MINKVTIPIIRCSEGIFLRWFYNGFHAFNFQNGYEITQKSESMDIQVIQMFSRISKIERATRYKVDYSYQIILEGIKPADIQGFEGLLLAEKVEQYENSTWYEVEITRGDHVVREDNAPGYKLDFEITRRELSLSSSVLQKTLLLFIGSTLCDLDYDEVVPVNKQVNDIAEMQDRQSDFTNTFRIRKTRRMKALFELSGEVGVITSFPYQNQSCRLIQDGIEMIPSGYMILDRTDDQYYHVSVYSGNMNFFKIIEPLKLIDLLLPSTNHTWNVIGVAASHASDLDYVYPLLEPSDDGLITHILEGEETVNLFTGWLWPFVKMKAIWDEIFVNSGFTHTGDIITNDTFLKLFISISNLKLSNINTALYLYSIHVVNKKVMSSSINTLDCVYGTVTPVLSDDMFTQHGIYVTRFAGDFTFRVVLKSAGGSFVLPLHVYIYAGEVQVAEMFDDGNYDINPYVRSYKGSYTATALEFLTIRVTITGLYSYDIQVINIDGVRIDYLSAITPRLHLPEMTQTEYIKMVCNLFALIPETDARKKNVFFWSYNLLYDNIPIARDWSNYLSEREDETEFKFGDYAQNNNLKYKESNDVIKGNGDGILKVDDDTLPFEKDVVEIPVSTCDEVELTPMFEGVNVSRINFNKYNADTGKYDQNASIDPRIVYVDRVADASPPIKKLTLFDDPELTNDLGSIENPKKASSIEVSFSQLVLNYAGLSRMLTKTNLRRCKFNLPVYEVAGLKHYIPIYLSQYKAYFYVNKINNYIPGKLCIIDLIKL